MRTIIFAAFSMFAALLMFGSSAEAGANCKGLSKTACEAALKAAARAPYRGPLKPTTTPMACIRAVGYGHSEIVWINGNRHNYTSAPVIAMQGARSGHTERFSLDAGLTVIESCIPRSKLNGIRQLTICTGTTPGQGYHWELSSAEIARLKSTGHLTSYLPLLAHGDINRLPVSTVRRAYKVRYGT